MSEISGDIIYQLNLSENKVIQSKLSMNFINKVEEKPVYR